MSARRRPKLSGAFVGSLLGLGAGLLAMPIMMDEFTVFFWLTVGLVVGGGIGFVRDLFSLRHRAQAD